MSVARKVCSSIMTILLVNSAASCNKKTSHRSPQDIVVSTAIADATITNTLSAGTENVVIPAGSLAIDTTVTISQVAAPEAFSAVYDSSPKASSAVEILAKTSTGEAVTQALGTLMISIGYSADLSLATTDKTAENLCVLNLSSANPDQKFVWRRNSLTVDESTKVVRFSTKVFGTFQAIFCGSTALPSFTEVTLTPPPISTAPASELDGVWNHPCRAEKTNASGVAIESIKKVMSVSGDQMQALEYRYYNGDCSAPGLVSRDKVGLRIVIADSPSTGAGTKTIDFTILSRTATPYLAFGSLDGINQQIDGAAGFNSALRCGFSDWQNNVERDVLDKECGDASKSQKTVKGTTEYDLYKVTAGTICYGVHDDAHQGETAATRPITIDTDDCFTRE